MEGSVTIGVRRYEDKGLQRFVSRVLQDGGLTLAHYESEEYSGPVVVAERRSRLGDRLQYSLSWKKFGDGFVAYPNPKYKKKESDEKHKRPSRAKRRKPRPS